MALKIESHNQYNAEVLDESKLPSEPTSLFREWLQTAIDFPVKEPEAVALSTATKDGIPSTRYVLLKTADERGFVIYTNYESRKGKEMESNPWASLAFYWREMSRSVRVVGQVERASSQETAEYYNSRPLGSRVGAWASPQSTDISGRDVLEKRVDEIEQRFGIKSGSTGRKAGELAEDDSVKIDPPPYWGGIRIVPTEVEFWAVRAIVRCTSRTQGRPNRLHDRFVYRRQDRDDQWSISRLAP